MKDKHTATDKVSKSVSRPATSGRFVMKNSDSSVFINGKRVLVPAGKSSIGRDRIGKAVEKVVSRRRSA
jgi:hypothetical protein